MYDDSIGLKIVEYIAENELDTGFQVIDLSANLINLLYYFNQQTTQIIIVDSAKMGLSAGEYRFFSPQAVSSTKKVVALSTHEGDLLSILRLAQELSYTIPVLKIMGIEPLLIKNEFGLSTILEESIPLYTTLLINEFDSSLAVELH
jgi:hydrogenase maturation protease